MQSSPTKAVLRALTEEDVVARVDLIMKAFWDNTKDIDEMIVRIEKTRNELVAQKVVPFLSIMHCEKLLNSVQSFSWTGQEMPYEWFVIAILHATNWVTKDKREAFVVNYLLVETDSVPESPDTLAEYEHAQQEEEDFGFEITPYPMRESAPLFLLPFLYLLAAIQGMIDYHKMNK